MVLITDYPSTLSLESRIDRLSFESSYLGNAIGLFNNMASDLVGNLKSKFASAELDKEIEPHFREIASLFKDVSKSGKDMDFLTLSKVLVDVPEGYTGNFMGLCNRLNTLGPTLHSQAPQLLQEYNLILSAFLTNEQDKISLNDHTPYFNKVDKMVKESAKELNKDFDAGRTTSKARLSTVISRYSEIEPLDKETTKLLRIHREATYKKVREQVNQSVDLLDLIIKGIKSEEITNISPAAALNISKGANIVANYVELIGIYRYRLEQYNTALALTLRKIKQVA